MRLFRRVSVVAASAAAVVVCALGAPDAVASPAGPQTAGVHSNSVGPRPANVEIRCSDNVPVGNPDDGIVASVCISESTIGSNIFNVTVLVANRGGTERPRIVAMTVGTRSTSGYAETRRCRGRLDPGRVTLCRGPQFASYPVAGWGFVQVHDVVGHFRGARGVTSPPLTG